MLVLNIGSRSDDWRARHLSNFSSIPFILDNVVVASVEGFIQGIKFPENHINRLLAFQSTGVEAKRFGRKAEHKFVWWNEKTIPYNSSEHHQLIEKAIRAKFGQSSVAMIALQTTAGMVLTHDLGHPENPNTCLPAAVFCDILTRIREEATQARK